MPWNMGTYTKAFWKQSAWSDDAHASWFIHHIQLQVWLRLLYDEIFSLRFDFRSCPTTHVIAALILHNRWLVLSDFQLHIQRIELYLLYKLSQTILGSLSYRWQTVCRYYNVQYLYSKWKLILIRQATEAEILLSIITIDTVYAR